MIETIVQAVFTAILSTLGIGGLIYWMKRHIDALKGAVDAQQKTIGAQAEILKDFETLNKTMKTVIETVDAPAMLKRWEEYKKLVDHEKEIVRKQLVEKSVQFFEETQRIQERIQKGAIYEPLSQIIQILFNLILNLLPYILPERRKELLNMVDLPSEFRQFQETLLQMAETAPYVSPSEEIRKSSLFFPLTLSSQKAQTELE